MAKFHRDNLVYNENSTLQMWMQWNDMNGWLFGVVGDVDDDNHGGNYDDGDNYILLFYNIV